MNDRAPDFDELVGADVEATERARLQRVHDAARQAGPPPELPPRLAAAPTPTVVPLTGAGDGPACSPRRGVWRGAFAIGFLVADGGGPSTERVIALTGAGRRERLARGLRDRRRRQLADGARGRGARAAASGELYQLWLTKDGELAALCGSFLVETEGTTVVPMNAPWRFDEFDGWVVVEEGSTAPVLTT